MFPLDDAGIFLSPRIDDNPECLLDMMSTVYYHVHMNNPFGTYIRTKREARRKSDPSFSVRQLATRIGVEPSYLSKVERGETPPPSEEKIHRLAVELNDDPDVLLAMAGKVSTDLQDVIRLRPRLFASLLRELKDAPEHAVLRLVREVRDGEW